MEGTPLAFEKDINQIKSMLMNMGLNEYQASALAHLILVGETKPTTLSKISGVPSARIYGVLDELSKMGLVTIRPGRPVLYKPRPPEDIISSLMTMKREELKQTLSSLEGYAQDFANKAKKIYLKGAKGVPPVSLLRIVSVGDVSLEETRKIYESATKKILVMSRAMEYFPEVSKKLREALSRGVNLKVLLVNPSLLEPINQKKQAEMINKIKEKLGKEVALRFSDEIPLRGCITDPDNKGQALFLVEDPGVPFFLREAAITSHPSVIKGLALMFDLMWKHKSKTFSEIATLHKTGNPR